MSRLQYLPAEIRSRIYEFVFQGTLVHPNPIMWAKQPSCDEKAKFEKLQADWPDPVGLLMTSKFFNTDPLIERAFYTNTTFCFGVRWQWPAFISFAEQKVGTAIAPMQLITSIMDTTPQFSSQSHLDLDQITVDVLPNLKHVYLSHLSKASNCMERVIIRVFGYESNEQWSCATCTSDLRLERYKHKRYCAYHRSPDPARFALQHSDTMVGRNSANGINSHFCAPSDFIQATFFNYNCSEHGVNRFGARLCKCPSGRALKERIMKDFVTLHLSWEMIFDRSTCGEDDIRVVSFPKLS